MVHNMSDILDRIETIAKKHHEASYGVSKFEIKWQTVDHIGVWAYCGKDEFPDKTNVQVSVIVPQQIKELGWYCYMGPIPEFE